ncbi:uncharacterized protein LOC108665792 [Hyalella azteca]|uniref:Uncharacterized protein LOC108665792 n=1 Tax=Hyalella azteca TaxID=294128 RepID=A0A979FV76_HYAAZ|nr:uncharacterized protein LOC108665792 [Hyalella azteca]
MEVEASVPSLVAGEAGWLHTALAALLPYIIWVPYQVYLSLNDGGWKTLVKQITFGSTSVTSGHAGAKPALEARCQRQPDAPTRPDAGVTWQRISHCMERYTVQSSKSEGSDRLVLMYAWLTSKRHHVHKYASLFTDLGMDVVTVKITGMDLMQPTTGSQAVAKEVVEFLAGQPQYSRILVFGFSVGAYAFSEAVKMMHERGEYAGVKERLVGHVWDSPVDLPNMPIGVATSVTANEKIRRYVTSCVDWFLRTRHDVATRHYIAAANYFYRGPVAGPSLYMCSSCDPLSPVPVNDRITGRWQQLGHDVTTKVFEDTAHCANYTKYPKEYRNLVLQFVDKIGMLH